MTEPNPASSACRGGIEPWGWIVNASLAAAKSDHPMLTSRAAFERPQIGMVRDGLSTRFAVVPAQAQEPVGAEQLRALYAIPDANKAA